MQKFFDRLNSEDRQVYGKLAAISSLQNAIPKKYQFTNNSTLVQSLSKEDLIKICKYSNPLLQPVNPTVSERIVRQSLDSNGNSCLHIASQYGNISMVKALLRHFKQRDNLKSVEPSWKQKIFGTQREKPMISLNTIQKFFTISEILNPTKPSYALINRTNNSGDTALFHCLRNNIDHKLEKVVRELVKYSDLAVKDQKGGIIYETTLPQYSVSKVRLMEYLKEKYLQQAAERE